MKEAQLSGERRLLTGQKDKEGWGEAHRNIFLQFSQNIDGVRTIFSFTLKVLIKREAGRMVGIYAVYERLSNQTETLRFFHMICLVLMKLVLPVVSDKPAELYVEWWAAHPGIDIMGGEAAIAEWGGTWWEDHKPRSPA